MVHSRSLRDRPTGTVTYRRSWVTLLVADVPAPPDTRVPGGCFVDRSRRISARSDVGRASATPEVMASFCAYYRADAFAR